MLLFPKQLEKLLLQYIKATASTRSKPGRTVKWERRDLRHFATGAGLLSHRFTADRSQLKGDYLQDPKLRSGYLLYFLPINFAKASDLLRRLPQTFWRRPQFKILDLGSGPGTGALAFLTEVAGRAPHAKVEIHLVDQNKKILQDAKQLLTAWHEVLKAPAQLTLHTISASLQKARLPSSYDFILLHHVLNELKGQNPTQRAEWLYPMAQKHLNQEGVLALIEPALKRPGRDLMSLRDHLIGTGKFQVLAPCLHEQPCPMLAGTNNDWCHFYIDWEEPDFMKELDRIIGNDNRFLKMSYMLLQMGGKKLSRHPHHYRVVSNRMATRGKTEVVLCGPPGRIRTSLLDRHQSPSNEAIAKVRRGDILLWSEWNQKEFTNDGNFRLSEKSEVKRI